MKPFSSLFHKVRKPKKKQPSPARDVDELRTIFKARYHFFKLLLNANNKSLEVMSEIEQALRGDQPFNLTYVRAKATKASTSCFQVIKNLDNLAPQKYQQLYSRFKDITSQINSILETKETVQSGDYVLFLSEIDRNKSDQVGTKISHLAEIRNHLQLNVPDGFAITAAAYQRFLDSNDLTTEIDRCIQATEIQDSDDLYDLSARIQQMIIKSPVPEDLRQEIMNAYQSLEKEKGPGLKLAVRSSSIGEDRPGASFAGQYRSELNISQENIIQAYKEVIASQFGLAAMSYRWIHGIPDQAYPMSVGCLNMVEGMAGGVIYTRNPVDLQDDSLMINAAWGLAKSVVDGSIAADTFIISRKPSLQISQQKISIKDHKLIGLPEEGLQMVETSEEERSSPVLSQEKVMELASLALRLEDYYKQAQDIEWTVEKNGTFVFLQCRPLIQLEREEEIKESPYPEDQDQVLLEGGTTASPGKASGEVYLVKKDVDTLSFPKGAILLAAQALPRWATVLNRASAVITEQGNVAGHLANVAREFQVPALFGINQAMETLSPGMEVTVDADNKKVYLGQLQLAPNKEPRAKKIMIESPVFQTLQQVSRHIVPLTLLDPQSPDFRPRNCRTLHDITRYCHEKSVQEMFRFGQDFDFPEKASKQLRMQVPMQFWVINLDDGFKEDITGDYVQLKDIDSIPMLALWQGMTVIDWPGPPPVDRKGFMSILMEATANPNLDPALRSDYEMRNYFMISKNFCSLQSRFGFHFSTVETLVTDRKIENYISFQFKGGAADRNRRISRAHLLTNILEEYGFQTEVKEDASFARIEDYDLPIMEERLKILGYLTIHTRQLDMVLAEPSSYEYYRQKLLKDIAKIIG